MSGGATPEADCQSCEQCGRSLSRRSVGLVDGERMNGSNIYYHGVIQSLYIHLYSWGVSAPHLCFINPSRTKVISAICRGRTCHMSANFSRSHPPRTKVYRSGQNGGSGRVR